MGAALAAWVLGCSTGKSESKQWGQWEYQSGDAQTTQQQIEKQQDLHGDPSAMNDPNLPEQRKMFSDTLTERQRRQFQDDYAEQMRKRSDEQAREAEMQREQTLAALKAANRKGGRK